MDIITLIISVVIIVLSLFLLYAIARGKTDAQGIWGRIEKIAVGIDNLPISGALFTLARSQVFVALVIAAVVYIATSLNPALAQQNTQLFVMLAGGWLVFTGKITLENYRAAQYTIPAQASNLSDAAQQMLNQLIVAALPQIVAGAKTNAPVNISATVTPPTSKGG